MPVTLPSPPLESVSALSDALETGGFSTRGYLATADPPQRWIPQKLFTAFVQDLAAGTPVVACAREVGWRYVMPQAFAEPVSAEVRVDTAGQHVVDHFAQGPQSAQTLAFTRQILDDPQWAGDQYTLQVLLVSALYVMALWVRHADPDRDWFVPLGPGDERLATGQYYDAGRFNAILFDLAKVRINQPTPDA